VPGARRELLTNLATRLSAELGSGVDADPPGGLSQLQPGDRGIAGLLEREDELLVRDLRLALASVAAAAGADCADDEDESAVAAALDGTEMVMRGELVAGNRDQLPALLPGFVFLVTLPVVDQDDALELSRRAERLIEGAMAERRGPDVGLGPPGL
jgi:hypothetical protein